MEHNSNPKVAPMPEFERLASNSDSCSTPIYAQQFSDPAMQGFEHPELEFDEGGIELAANSEINSDDDSMADIFRGSTTALAGDLGSVNSAAATSADRAQERGGEGDDGDDVAGRREMTREGNRKNAREEDDDEDDSNNEIKRNGVIEEDFEAQLGGGNDIIEVQDVINKDFEDVYALRILNVCGDDKMGRRVVAFYACRMPDPRHIPHDRVALYLVKMLEQFVTNDYSLVYFHHGLTNKNAPTLNWVIKTYRHFDRNFKKNLKALYLVHPSFLLKTFISALFNVISPKFANKLVKVHRLAHLEQHFHLDQLFIPQSVRMYDEAKVAADIEKATASSASSNQQANSAASSSKSFASDNPNQHQPIGFDINSAMHTQVGQSSFYSPLPYQQFNVSLQFIHHNNTGQELPIVMTDSMQYIRERAMTFEGIFRRSPRQDLLKSVQEQYNRGEPVDLFDIDDPLLASVLLKTFLRSLAEPLLTFELHDTLISLHGLSQEDKIAGLRSIITEQLPEYNYRVLTNLVEFLQEVAAKSEQNRMTERNLAIIFAPVLIWSRQHASIEFIQVLINLTEILIANADQIFV